MKPESRLEIARRRVVEAEMLVERQARLVSDLQQKCRPVQHAISLLALLHASLQAFRDALAVVEREGR